jgi:hypothetical protein
VQLRSQCGLVARHPEVFAKDGQIRWGAGILGCQQRLEFGFREGLDPGIALQQGDQPAQPHVGGPVERPRLGTHGQRHLRDVRRVAKTVDGVGDEFVVLTDCKDTALPAVEARDLSRHPSA